MPKTTATMTANASAKLAIVGRSMALRNGLIRVLQHRIEKRALAVAQAVVIPVVDLQASLQLETAAVGCIPFAQEIGEIAIKHEAIGAGVPLYGHVNRPLGGFEMHVSRLPDESVFFGFGGGGGELDLEVAS